MGGITQGGLMDLDHGRRNVASNQTPDRWAFVENVAERRGRYASRSTGEIDLGIAYRWRSRCRSQRAQNALVSNEDSATATPITQGHGHHH
jgi:hypothetical protein